MYEILFEDEMVIIANKPAGIPVHETKDPKRIDFTRSICNQLGYTELRTVNRLDLGTSGIVVLGKDPAKNKEIDDLFQSSEKEYMLIGEGIPDWQEKRFECFIKDGNKSVSLVRSGGKKAITIFSILGRDLKQKLFLAKAQILTGRRHQIRISISSLGHPILGDTTYGSKFSKTDRMFLHSYQLTYQKKDGSRISIQCPPPKEFLHFFPEVKTIV
jgi:23S rRNA pseudouridine1911/1915/1917 synthase